MPYTRTQLYIPKEINEEVFLLAQEEGRPQAEIYRELLGIGLGKKLKRKKLSSGEGLLRIASFAKRGPRDLSKNLASYLYGKKSPNYGQSSIR